MAVLTGQRASISGKAIAYSPAGAGGDTLYPGGDSYLYVKNGSASAITVTVVVPGNTKYGLPQPDVTSASIAATSDMIIGPLYPDLIDTDNFIHVTYSATATVSVAHLLV